jgi:hypothetical protein
MGHRCQTQPRWTVDLCCRSALGSAGHLGVVARTYQLPNGTAGVWDGFGCARSVVVFALTLKDQVVLVRQFQPGPDEVLLELPGRQDR